MEGLRAQNLFFARKNTFSLGPLNLDLPQRGLCCIVGPNGGGKSTLLQLLAGILRPSEGRVFLHGKPLEQMNRRQVAAQLGYLPQEVRPLYTFQVQEVVAMGRFCLDGGSGGRQPSTQKAVVEAMGKTATAHLARRSFSRLSGGERQRVLLASVLSRHPRILLLDEPSTGLDPHHGADFFRRLRMESQKDILALVVSHDINLAATFGDRMIFMNEGRILADGKPEEVLRSEALMQAYGSSMVCWPHPDQKGGAVLLPLRED
ncbi:ABC transporter ATP-binding protein [Desulfobotulus sp.]|uniref:ABC transporter ATP-binding protein n=1 Tax=Desulfobotulus sp. TaxID=1940337 RepID=UPI002A3697A6|nr:ABC transporter ATP-binding protein [Desulfobotulus sp.]MDY0162925.1 ABC transporter ATP-binding protein [Desulfobotulus sp.]